MNSGAPWPAPGKARARILDHQRKLHRWARVEPDRRFGDVFNLIRDRAMVVAWERVAGNRGARTAGVDAVTRHHVERRGVVAFLEELRSSLRDGTFQPLPVRAATIPKKGSKARTLGIPTLRDRVAQMALKLVLEPIFEDAVAVEAMVDRLIHHSHVHILKGDSYRLKDKQQEVTATTETTQTAQNPTGANRAEFNRR